MDDSGHITSQVWVTGSSGFIGRQLRSFLHRKGVQVCSLNRQARSEQWPSCLVDLQYPDSLRS